MWHHRDDGPCRIAADQVTEACLVATLAPPAHPLVADAGVLLHIRSRKTPAVCVGFLRPAVEATARANYFLPIVARVPYSLVA